MRYLIVILMIFCIVIPQLQASAFDLNTLEQDFILETKRIEIPGHPEAFNGCIVAWKGRILMSFRTYDPQDRSTDAIGLVWLDDQFNPVSPPTILKREYEITAEISRAQDPRLIAVGDDLFIVYSNQYPFECPTSRMYVAKVQCENETEFVVFQPVPLLHYDQEVRTRKEKNWVPFVHAGELFLSYSIQPHRVFWPVPYLNACETVAESHGDIKWKWGQLRGGTPALRVGDSYLAFFHSDSAMATLQSEGKTMNHYFMGAYTFQSAPPFALTAISRQPLVAKTFYEGPMYNTWKPLRVVFPMGIIVRGDLIWVSYGRQDHEIWVARIDRKKLMNSLEPVQMLESK